MLADIGFFIAFVSHKFSYLDFFLVYSVESLHNIGKLYIERNTFSQKKIKLRTEKVLARERI